MVTLFLPADLRRDEGWDHDAYQDSFGNWTIGCGHKDSHVHAGMTWDDRTIQAQLMADIQTATRGLDGSPIFSPWWRALTDFRQDCLVNMAFNMGASCLATFTTFLEFLREGQYSQAAEDLLTQTLWEKQVGERAQRIARQLETGVHQQ